MELGINISKGNIMSTLYENIKKYRKALKISQNKLAQKLGVSQTAVAHYENGHRNPTIEAIMLMAKIFNISVDELLGYESGFKQMDEKVAIDTVILELFTLLVHKDYYSFQQLMEKMAHSYPMNVMIDEIIRVLQTRVGLEWEMGRLTVADEHYITHAISRTMAALYPLESPILIKKRAIALAVGTEEHTLGIELISSYLQTKGIDTWYLGTHVPMMSLNQMIEDYKPDYLLLSITLKEHVNILTMVLESLSTKKVLQIFIGGQATPYVDVSTF